MEEKPKIEIRSRRLGINSKFEIRNSNAEGKNHGWTRIIGEPVRRFTQVGADFLGETSGIAFTKSVSISVHPARPPAGGR
jgi:hypothetical protein